MATTGKWGLCDGEVFLGDYSTAEEAIRDGFEKLGEKEFVIIGKYADPTPFENYFTAESFFEHVHEQDDYWFDDPVIDVSAEVEKELEDNVRAVIREWRIKHGVAKEWHVVRDEITVAPSERPMWFAAQS